MKRCWKLWTIGLAVILASFAAWQRASAQEEELDPVKIAPDVQKVVFENALVRVTEERMPPGRVVRKHRHMHGLTIALADYQMEQKLYPSGQIIHSNRHFGEINWNETFIHEARNAGTTNQYVVRVELK
ncbi:MAG TPA: hypothetical protein VN841_27410 [Bryobacteraceae bacterium]|nr:hypothetical protein [Bryobacteraceae bacterium]